MPNHTFRRFLSLLFTCYFLFSCLLLSSFAEEPGGTGTEPTEEVTMPVTEPTEETTEPVTEPTKETTEPVTEPTEETTEPATEPTEAVTEPVTEPSEPATQPTEESGDFATEPTIPNILPISETPELAGPNLYFGQLHAHIDTDTLQNLFLNASRKENMDFCAVAPYSDSFDTSSGMLSDCTADSVWTSGKTAAAAATTSDFTGIFGFEMNWPEQMQIGHISVFNTPGFRSWKPDAYGNPTKLLQAFYEELAAVPDAIVQWNHPGNQYGTFFSFNYFTPAADTVISLLEVANSQATTAAGYLDGYQHYSRALDSGWHIAPTNSQGNGRTVILAPTLTEASLYEALKNRRVYATEDTDLEIVYTMDGHAIGSLLKKRHIGETADIVADLYDPTDSSIGLVEVITDGGLVAARQTATSACDVIRFSLDTDYRYYYLRITQPDGDIAVTAPIWVEAAENLGISDLLCETDVPVQKEDIALTLELYNRETTDFLVESLEILADDTHIAEDQTLSVIPADSELSHRLTLRCDSIGQTKITVRLSGTLDGAPREYEETLSLSLRQSSQVTGILIDGNHGNAGLSDLQSFRSLASDADIRVTVADTAITEEMLKDCRFLLVTAPSQSFSEDFLNLVSEYIRCGGSILVCGQSTSKDGAISSSAELNRLLAAIGSTMRFNRDAVADPMYNGGEETLLFLNDIRNNSSWCSGITEGQVYRHADGCSVSPGNGSSLVHHQAVQSRARTSPVTVLASEEISSGGTVLAAGSLLIENAALKEPGNLWDSPYANRTISQNLLGIGNDILPLSTVRQARNAENGMLLRIRGYVTAGTANHWNSFPDTLYLQDDTGGIAVTPVPGEEIAVGTPVEIIGTAQETGGNRTLKLNSCKVLNTAFYRYLPATGDWKTLLDADLHGGELVQVEGKCTEVILADDGCVSSITLTDNNGNFARVLVEDSIFSGATGKNELHKTIRKDYIIRAAGILHMDETGKPVIRVRNCEEVVHVPPRTVYINPKTFDWMGALLK